MSKAFTHKGWFWVCPVYLSLSLSEEPQIVPRSGKYGVLFSISMRLQRAYINTCEFFNPDCDPDWLIIITGAYK